MERINSIWSPAPSDPTLTDHEVHVWRASLELPFSQVQALSDILTDDELERANRFSFEIDRQRFIVARGILRCILGCYTTMGPNHLRFHYNQYGKPSLEPESSADLLKFNLSHSGSLALYAMTRNMEIGVDLERVRSDFAYGEIAECFFSPHEVSILRSMPAEKKLEAFYKCWTRKEAYIKAHGKSLPLALEGLAGPFASGEPPVLLITKDEPQERSLWTLQDLKPGLGYMGALAVKGTGCKFRYWEWKQL